MRDVITLDPKLDLVLERNVDVPRRLVWRAWTEPEHLMKWFTPAPWKTVEVKTDLRPGGSSYVVMESPEGQKFPNRGIYLDVVPNERLVFTDAYTQAWAPSEKPFMTVVLTFADAGPGKTLYTARVRHWSVADREAHEKMGFHQGWGQCAAQLEATASQL